MEEGEEGKWRRGEKGGGGEGGREPRGVCGHGRWTCIVLPGCV